MQLTLRQKQRLKIRFLYIFYDIMTRGSLYFIAGLLVGVWFVVHQLI
jgi:hypothetical protein